MSDHDIALYGLIVAITAFVFPYFYNAIAEHYSRKNKRPELTVELKKRSDSLSEQTGARTLPYNKDHVRYDEDSNIYVVDGSRAWFNFKHTVNLKLIIKNSAEHTAYYPKLHYLTNERFAWLEELDFNKPIPSGQEIVLNGALIFLEDCHPSQAANLGEITIPSQITEMRLLLEYQNSAKYKFYTEYRVKETSYHFLNEIP